MYFCYSPGRFHRNKCGQPKDVNSLIDESFDRAKHIDMPKYPQKLTNKVLILAGPAIVCKQITLIIWAPRSR
jgi:hypothetical protein